MPSLSGVGLGQWSFEIVAEGGGWLRFFVRGRTRILAVWLGVLGWLMGFLVEGSTPRRGRGWPVELLSHLGSRADVVVRE